MFVAWRDLRFARGRFLLIGAVVALITLLVGFLAGLTGGLASQNVSAVLGLPGDRLVLQDPASGSPSFGTSEIDAETVQAWREAPGVSSVLPVGIAQGRAQLGGAGSAGFSGAAESSGASGSAGASSSAGASVSSGGSPVGVALFGFSAPSGAGEQTDLTELAPAEDDEVGLSAGAAKDLDASVGDRISIAGSEYRVAKVGGDAWYSHTPVVAMTPASWQAASQRMGGSGGDAVTVLAVSGSPDWDAVASSTKTVAQPTLASLGALETFKSEIGSLGLMIAMLFGISALVVGAFFTVWTMQRAGDIAVLKALGATTGSLVRDALGQALVVLVLGIGVGLALVVGLGTLAGGALPFLLSPLTTALPAVIMAVLGLAGAAFALRSVTSADPLTALGSHR
ncbi:ABC transporter substrate-binding protein [Leucobacter sp. OLJS4]|uniref:ABC transporter permease n=1 Tax=unclassified Leucobacter TaxID=2621730 RepID=UPI000C199A82|nr:MULTISPECIES: ABC transporter permease [unclassified Leucobacter]PIJ41975.1 ABC transporter substrate-binding protein [Leucobacter sp. OLES1]PII84531.1 ABC transporter substrate-binding protein [Leucobacter sp. OLCALW19]PII91042.1 ABC transporter substrate-binding protein [Leucobacter sp. OLAS13]PII95645.1 ABC transporter substrate-binding protein [Leucobacter sp. OLTLW20]PII97776.1 ABC transporter substrate-binding protein [Leucobacter sp. OLDS2]